MGNSQKIDSVEPVPIAPREITSADQGNGQEPDSDAKMRRKRAFSPAATVNVKYFHKGERSRSRNAGKPGKPETSGKKKNPAKRADQLGMLLLGCSLVVVILVLLTLYLNDKKYLFSTSKTNETSTAVVDFYQGNHAFSEKVAEEKAAKEAINGHQAHGNSNVNDDLEVPLGEQLSSMSEKMKQMRSLQQADEAPPPTQDTGPKLDTAPLKPTKDADFQSPVEFNKNLPKALQTNQ